MKTYISETLSNGNTINYQKLENDHCYHAETNDKVVSILEKAWYSHSRLKIYFGDAETGKDWHEEHDTIGYIGFTTGKIKIPILLNNSRSYGGGAILDHCIVKIKDVITGYILYQHSNYAAPVVEIKESKDSNYEYETLIDGSLYGRHHSLRSAQICKSKLI